MRILFDQGTPAPLRHELIGHEVATSFELGWSDLVNGELLGRAASEFDLFITTDQNLQYQQNLTARTIAILVLSTTSWPRIKKHVQLVISAVNSIRSDEYRELAIPE